jgi:hypothetical protein
MLSYEFNWLEEKATARDLTEEQKENNAITNAE